MLKTEMSVSYFVRYEATADDAAVFLAHYRNRHVPILLSWPGIQAVRLHHPLSWNDPMQVNKTKLLLLVEMQFENIEALEQALNSRERATARADFENFPSFDGSVFHQAVETEIYRP